VKTVWTCQRCDIFVKSYSDYGKELLPEEIERLLNGKYFDRYFKDINDRKRNTSSNWTTSKYPTDIVNLLENFFLNDLMLKSAYLGWISA
jgi:hypothetical protein